MDRFHARAAAILVFFALAACATADESATVQAKRAAGCKTALDLIASQNPNLPMHPVFQEILNSPSLKGTLFVPTAAAWDAFFSTVRQRHGNPEAPAMVARYGQVMLYHLAQDINVPIATPTPGAPKFAFDTASTLQCSVGPGLPNNRIIVKKTPQAILLQHGTGNATIVSQPIGYCGGEAYLVNEVLVPCSDVAAVMGEIANVPSPCKNNVEGVLHRDGLSYYNALLLATGVNRPIFASVRNFTIFAPTDAAIQAAYDSGAFDYPELFATNKSALTGAIAYHAVPQVALVAPSRMTTAMDTLLSQNQGKASCPNPKLSWRPDGFVYGGAGAAKVGGTYDRGCAAVIFQIDSMLQPCCKPMTQLVAGLKASRDSPAARALQVLQEKVKANKDGERATFIMPSEGAWAALNDEYRAAANRSLSYSQIDAIAAYLYTGADVADVVDSATPVRTELSLKGAALAKEICAKGTNATIAFAYDTAAAAEPAAAAGAPTAGPAAAGGATVQLLTGGGLRRLFQTKLPTGAAPGSLLLPTAFGAAARKRGDGAAVLSGPVMVYDGAAAELRAPRGIPVTAITYGCDGSVYHVDAVPLPCNFVGRTAAEPPRAKPAAAPKALPMTISAGLVDTGNITVANATAPKLTSSAVPAAAPLAASAVAATLLAAAVML